MANRLPVTLVQTASGIALKASPGGMAAALQPTMADPSTVWVGYAGTSQKLSRRQLAVLGMHRQLQPVSIDDDIYARYYKYVANGALWPLAHGFKPLHIFSERDWQAYVAANERFADAVARIAEPDDLIWVHDFHLLLLPKLLRERGVKSRIGHFLHVPVPTKRLLGQLPHWQDVLDGWRAADLCGVQTARDARRLRRHFGGTPAVRAFPVGIDYATYAVASSLPAVRRRMHALSNRYAGQTIIFSVSRLDYTKGILEQLAAVEQLLASGKKCIYKLVVSPSREDVAGYWQLKQDIDACVAEINQRFANARPIHYEYRNMEFEELASWYARADVMLVTPLVDGMNLVAKEYIATRPDDEGVLVLSKTIGAATQLKAALLVDPHNVPSIVKALKRALTMPVDERQTRSRALRHIIQTEDAHHWVKSFTDALAAQDTF